MSTLNNSLLLGAPASGGYQIQRSLRFNSSDSAFCARTPSSAGNRKTFTFAAWVKRARVPNVYNESYFFSCIFSPNNSDSNYFRFGFAGDRLFCGLYGTGVSSAAVYRDYSAWYHVVLAVDTTQATASNRIRLYVNGSEITAFNSASYPAQNTDLAVNSTNAHHLGYTPDPTYGHDGYLADVHLIDGQQLTPSSFTEVSATTGQLIPKAYTGSFGTNGFHLPFSDNSTAAALGTDTSGNGNTWTVNNISVGGSGYYARYLTQTSGNGTFSGPYAAFDGDLTTACQVVGATGTGVITFSPASAISASSLRIYLYTGETGNGSPVSISVNGGAFTNCTTLGGTNNTTEWVTATSLITGGQITSIAVQRVNMSGFGYTIHAIEVNGSQLIDSSFAGNDSLVDTPTSYGTDTGAGGEVRGNYCTWNPLTASITGATLSNGNLDLQTPITNYGLTHGTIGVSSGKWYWEIRINSLGDALIGIDSRSITASNLYLGAGISYSYTNSGTKYGPNDASASYGATYTSNDVIGVALDLDAGTLSFYKNGTSQGQAFSGIAGTFVPAFSDGSASTVAGANVTANFGQRPFAYPAPSGFKALCTTNLPAPTITKPSTAMDVKLYTGNGSTQTISGLGFSPDFVWIKQRDTTRNHVLYDTVRGATKALLSSTTDSEQTYSTSLTAFNSDGFALGSDDKSNGSSGSYAAWAWDAGSSTVTNTQGSITSQVRANASAGFSVVTYTGTGSNATVGHGLGVAPQLIITKCRGAASDWGVYHASVGATAYLRLNLTNASSTGSGPWNNTAPTNTVFSIGANAATNTANTMVAYCFAPVAGYSSFGSYTGNGSADGPFVYTGFRPRWILFKNTSQASDWAVYDAARSPYNVTNDYLTPNTSDAEGVDYANGNFDILANGFKIRATWIGENGSGNTLVYAAFAENPFQYARAR